MLLVYDGFFSDIKTLKHRWGWWVRKVLHFFFLYLKKTLDKNEAKIVNKPEKDTFSSLLQSLKTAFYLAAVPISFTVSVQATDSVISFRMSGNLSFSFQCTDKNKKFSFPIIAQLITISFPSYVSYLPFPWTNVSF